MNAYSATEKKAIGIFAGHTLVVDFCLGWAGVHAFLTDLAARVSSGSGEG